VSRHTFRAEVGPEVDTKLIDTMRDRAARAGCEALLRSQLRAGEHLLSMPIACGLAEAIGMPAAHVRPANTLITTEGASR
jgi:hypothetical protein